MKAKRSRVILSAISVLLVLSLLNGRYNGMVYGYRKSKRQFEAGILDIEVNPAMTDLQHMSRWNSKIYALMLYENFYKGICQRRWRQCADQQQSKPRELSRGEYPGIF